MMHKCIIVKIGEAKKRQFVEKRGKCINFAKSLEKFMNDVEIGGNMQYASFS